MAFFVNILPGEANSIESIAPLMLGILHFSQIGHHQFSSRVSRFDSTLGWVDHTPILAEACVSFSFLLLVWSDPGVFAGSRWESGDR